MEQVLSVMGFFIFVLGLASLILILAGRIPQGPGRVLSFVCGGFIGIGLVIIFI